MKRINLTPLIRNLFRILQEPSDFEGGKPLSLTIDLCALIELSPHPCDQQLWPKSQETMLRQIKKGMRQAGFDPENYTIFLVDYYADGLGFDLHIERTLT